MHCYQESPLTDERIVRAFRTFRFMFYCEYEIDLKNECFICGYTNGNQYNKKKHGYYTFSTIKPWFIFVREVVLLNLFFFGNAFLKVSKT